MRYFVVISLANGGVRCVIQAESLLEAKGLIAKRCNDENWAEYYEIIEPDFLTN